VIVTYKQYCYPFSENLGIYAPNKDKKKPVFNWHDELHQ